MEKDLISIVIPVYNVEKYLKECLNSILNQTYKNIEIILVDDGSKDNSLNICNQYEKEYKNIKVYHQKNSGPSIARNNGIKEAKGKYITFIDSDDTIEKDYIEYLYNLIRKNKADMSICASTVITDKNKINHGYKQIDRLMNQEEAMSDLLTSNGYDVSPCAKMYNLEKIKEIKFPEHKVCEDNGTIYRLILAHNKIMYGHESKYNYFRRNGSIMKSEFNLNKLDLIEMTDTMCNDIINKFPNLKKEANLKQIEVRLSILRQIAEVRKYKQYKEIIKEMKRYVISNKKIILSKDTKKVDKIAYISLRISFKFYRLMWKMYKIIKYGD